MKRFAYRKISKITTTQRATDLRKSVEGEIQPTLFVESKLAVLG